MDKSNFSEQIKNSFEEIFRKEVPQTIWTELSSTLEEEGFLSDEEILSNEEKDLLQSSFEETHQAQAPAFAWKNIAASIEEEGGFEEESSPEENFGEIIKSSFLTRESSKAPNIWSKIEGEIEGQSAEDTIRDGFEESYKGQAPDYIWNAVRHQINIDSVWERLTVFLDRMRYRQLWKQRLRRWASYATVIALMHACLPITYNGVGELEPTEPKMQMEPSGPLAEEKLNQNTSKDKKDHSSTLQTNSGQLPTLTKKLPSEQLASVEDFSNLGKSDKKATTVFEQPDFAKNFENKKKWSIALVIPSPKKENITDLQAGEDDLVMEDTSNGLLEEDRSILSEKEPTVTVSKEELLAINWLKPAAYSLLEHQTVDLFPEVEEYPYSPKESKVNKSAKMELGFITALGNSFLLNEETFQSWDENSLLNHNLSGFTHIGFLLVQPLSKKSALAVELSGYHQIRQGFGFFSTDGYYKSKVKELNYARFGALYQHEVCNYELLGLKTELLGRAGFYLAYLTEELAIMDAVSNSTNTFNKYDLGTKFMLGQAHRWDNFVFEYGGQLDMGLLNVFNGESFGTNIQVNHTRILNIAAYLSLRYRF